MKKLNVLQMENLQGGKDCSKQDAWAGAMMGAGTFLCFGGPVTAGLGVALLTAGAIYSGGRLSGLGC